MTATWKLELIFKFEDVEHTHRRGGGGGGSAKKF
jgi:hypothetical protein